MSAKISYTSETEIKVLIVMNKLLSFSRENLALLAYKEGGLCLKGSISKAGPEIEKYLNVFRQTLGQRDPKYFDLNVGYDWCCAYVYYLIKKAGFELSITPLSGSNWTLGAVKTWHLWALQENIFLESFHVPEAGDLVLFDRLIEDVELDHIGIVIQNNDIEIITSEGNYYNCSGIFLRKKDDKIRGYIRLPTLR